MYGHILEDGREVQESAKYRKATELKVKKINEDEFLELIKDEDTKIELP